MSTVVIDSGGANLASLSYALQRLGADVTVTLDPAVIAQAERVLLPGVGAAGAAMIIGIIKMSGGMGNTELSMKATKAKTQSACRCSAMRRVQR